MCHSSGPGKIKKQLVGLMLLAGILVTAGLVWWSRQQLPMPMNAGSDALIPFLIVGSEKEFSELQQAIESAEDGDVIQILGNGPYQVGRLEIGARQMTLSAAPNSVPVLELIAEPAYQPSLTSERPLRLEGLEVRDMRPVLEEFAADRVDPLAAIHVTDDLTLTDCRVITTSGRGCVSIAGGNTTFVRTHLSAQQAACVWWHPQGEQQLHIADSLLSGKTAITMRPAAMSMGSPSAYLRLERNSFTCEELFQTIIDVQPIRPVAIRATNNVFASQRLLTLNAVRMFRRLRIVTQSQENYEIFVRHIFDWSEAENIYVAGMSAITQKRMNVLNSSRTSMAEIAEWQALWDTPPQGSIEATIRVPEEVAHAEWRIEQATGELPKSAGVDHSTLGPPRN